MAKQAKGKIPKAKEAEKKAVRSKEVMLEELRTTENNILRERQRLNIQMTYPKRFRKDRNAISINGYLMVGLPEKFVLEVKDLISEFLEKADKELKSKEAKVKEIRQKLTK